MEAYKKPVTELNTTTLLKINHHFTMELFMPKEYYNDQRLANVQNKLLSYIL